MSKTDDTDKRKEWDKDKFFHKIKVWNSINTRERNNLDRFLELGKKIDVHYLSMADLAELKDFCSKIMSIAEDEYYKRCEGYE